MLFRSPGGPAWASCRVLVLGCSVFRGTRRPSTAAPAAQSHRLPGPLFAAGLDIPGVPRVRPNRYCHGPYGVSPRNKNARLRRAGIAASCRLMSGQLFRNLWQRIAVVTRLPVRFASTPASRSALSHHRQLAWTRGTALAHHFRLHLREIRGNPRVSGAETRKAAGERRRIPGEAPLVMLLGEVITRSWHPRTRNCATWRASAPG